MARSANDRRPRKVSTSLIGRPVSAADPLCQGLQAGQLLVTKSYCPHLSPCECHSERPGNTDCKEWGRHVDLSKHGRQTDKRESRQSITEKGASMTSPHRLPNLKKHPCLLSLNEKPSLRNRPPFWSPPTPARNRRGRSRPRVEGRSGPNPAPHSLAVRYVRCPSRDGSKASVGIGAVHGAEASDDPALDGLWVRVVPLLVIWRTTILRRHHQAAPSLGGDAPSSKPSIPQIRSCLLSGGWGRRPGEGPSNYFRIPTAYPSFP